MNSVEIPLSPPVNPANPVILSTSSIASIRGFTLLELMVATAVASLLLVVLFSIIGETMGVSRRTVQSLMAANSGATAMDAIAADLGGLMPLEGEAEYLFVGEEVVGGVTNAYLRFLTASPNNGGEDAPQNGQPAFVTYRVARYDLDTLDVADGAANPSALFRVSSNGTDTFDEMGADDIDASTTAPAMEDFFANNVVEFSVQPLRDGVAVPGLNSLRLRGNEPVGADRPDTLQVTLVTLDEAGAQRLRDGLSLSEAKLRHGRVLTRRVRLVDSVLPTP